MRIKNLREGFLSVVPMKPSLKFPPGWKGKEDATKEKRRCSNCPWRMGAGRGFALKPKAPNARPIRKP